ncbi:MAG: toll/interleukin-1 receptor domain-containing protein [Pseudohongiellaceae bacterium]
MKIFVSYRRSDTRHIAGRLVERLESMPGIRKVFLDVDGIDPGSNFENMIDDGLRESDICLILIGDDWMGLGADGKPARILGAGDFVRQEAAKALVSDTKVIPILVDGAPMPSKQDLPTDLHEIVSIDAVFLRHNSFKQDIEHVEDAIFARKARSPIARFFSRHPFFTLILRVLGGVLIAAVVLLALAIFHNIVTGGQYLEATFGSQGLVWVIIIGTLAAGGAIAAWRGLHR